MNVVYRGVSNPFTISFAGISANKISAARTPGLKKGKTIFDKGRKKTLNGPSDYELDLTKLPAELRGKTIVDIVVTGELPSGERVVSKVPFRIKPLPTPFGSLDKRNPETVTKAELKNSVVTATFGADFDFDLPLRVQSFKITIEGEGSFQCDGSELSGPAKRAIERARRNSLVRVSDIRTRAIGSTTEVSNALPASFTLM
jgi:hypothetical protein